MKTPVRAIPGKLAAGFGRMRDASRAVKATVAVELAAATILASAIGSRLRARVDALVDLDRLPPWRIVPVFVLVGIAAALLRSWRPDQALRRWHGVLLRRVDERFG